MLGNTRQRHPTELWVLKNETPFKICCDLTKLALYLFHPQHFFSSFFLSSNKIDYNHPVGPIKPHRLPLSSCQATPRAARSSQSNRWTSPRTWRSRRCRRRRGRRRRSGAPPCGPSRASMSARWFSGIFGRDGWGVKKFGGFRWFWLKKVECLIFLGWFAWWRFEMIKEVPVWVDRSYFRFLLMTRQVFEVGKGHQEGLLDSHWPKCKLRFLELGKSIKFLSTVEYHPCTLLVSLMSSAMVVTAQEPGQLEPKQPVIWSYMVKLVN